MLNIRGLKYDFPVDSLAYKTTKFYAKVHVHNFGQKQELQFLEKFAM